MEARKVMPQKVPATNATVLAAEDTRRLPVVDVSRMPRTVGTDVVSSHHQMM